MIGTYQVGQRCGFYPEPRGPRVLPVGELVLWYGMFAPCGRLLGTTGFAPVGLHYLTRKILLHYTRKTT
jgi:hypothetical protein